MTERINGLDRERVARLYDALHLARAAAAHEYLEADDAEPETHARGRRDGLDEALTILDEMVDAAEAAPPELTPHTAAYADALHRVADLITRGELPPPSVATSMSWYPSGDDARGQAAKIARTLGGEWRAERMGGGDYLHATATLVPGDGYRATLRANVAIEHKRPEAPLPPAAAFAAELAAAVVEGTVLTPVEGTGGRVDVELGPDGEVHDIITRDEPLEGSGDGSAAVVDR